MAPPLYKLYSPPTSSFAFAPLVVSEYVGISVEVVKVEDVGEPSKSPTGKFPVLETPDGDVIVSSQAIAKFIAGLRRDKRILGSGSLQESLAIEDWTNWVSQELELPACVSYYMASKCIPHEEETYEKAKRDLSSCLDLLETQLQRSKQSNPNERAFLVTDYITLADVVAACTLVYPLMIVVDESFMQSYPMVVKWFTNCVNEPEFTSVLGHVRWGRSEH